jgi:hypothetical protein
MWAERGIVEYETGGTYNDQWPVKRLISSMFKIKIKFYREIIAVCSQIHTKHIIRLWAGRGIVEC